MMVKRVGILICIIFLVLTNPVSAGQDDLLEEQLDRIDTFSLDLLLEEVNSIGRVSPLSFDAFVDWFKGGEFPLSASEIFWAFLTYLFEELLLNVSLLAKILVLALLASLLTNLRTSFSNESVAAVASLVIYLLLVLLALNGFQEAMAIAKDLIYKLESFLLAILPLLITLLAGIGAITTASLFSPVLVFTVSFISLLTAEIVLPLLFLAAVAQVISGLHSQVSLTGMVRLLKQAALLLLGLSFTVFLAVISIQGIAGAVADGVALRTVKYMAGSLIPVFGGMFADATELVLSSSLIIKNAVGILGLIAVFLVAGFPILKLIALVLIYRIAAALVEPVSGKEISGILEALGDILTLLTLATGLVVLMFIVVLSVILGVGNLAVMMR